MSARRPPLVCLAGPTASGKTGLVVELVQELPLDIVSVDSAQVYQGMDIGTAKPDAATLAVAPHRLIDLCPPEAAYSAARFVADARREIAAIHAAGRVPLLVGGTMLYFKALLEGLAPLPGADPAVRARLLAEARRHGWARLHQRLAAVDPAAAARIHPNDPQRLQRALEVYELTGRPLSALQRAAGPGALDEYEVLFIGLLPADRADLHRRIARRFEAMLAEGLVEEVRALRRRPGLHGGLPSMRSVGYRQVWAYLEGDHAYAEMVERGIIATRQLAKRQMTWLRGLPYGERLDPAELSAARLARRIRAKLQTFT